MKLRPMKIAILLLLLSGCGGVVCGAGTEEMDGECRPVAARSTEGTEGGERASGEVPPAGEGELRPVAASSDTLHIEVAADGSLSIDGAPVADADLAARIAEYVSQLPNPAAARATITASAHTTHDRALYVIDRLRAAGVERFALDVAAD